MRKRNSQIRRYTILYWVYFVTSVTLLFIFGITFFICYATSFQEKVTLAHLVLLVLLLMLVLFFRMNAYHFQKYLWKEAARIRVSRERQQYLNLKGERQFYD